MPDNDFLKQTIMSNDNQVTQGHIYTVTQLNQETKVTLEKHYSTIWIEGEVSNLVQPSSGHLYFTLKDQSAQIRCAMFRPHQRILPFKPENGMHVVAFAKVSLYTPRGDYQLIIERLEETGDGALQRAFEQLKKKLYSEGLFAEDHKKNIPLFPNQIGVITSPTGAAIRDILSVCQRRFPSIPILIYPTSVQGEQASHEIVRAIQLANKHKTCDVLILSRGGGSLEDLWPFNEERVARAIHQSHLPIVSAVGHEIDITISDFVSDKRAPTPSAAAELVCPEQNHWIKQTQQLFQKIQTRCLNTIHHYKQQLIWIRRSIRHPREKLVENTQRLDQLETRLIKANKESLKRLQSQIEQRQHQLFQFHPHHRIEKSFVLLNSQRRHIQHLILRKLHNEQNYLTALMHSLKAIGPLATLERGYAIVTDINKNTILRDASKATQGDKLQIQLHKGKLISTVEK